METETQQPGKKEGERLNTIFTFVPRVRRTQLFWLKLLYHFSYFGPFIVFITTTREDLYIKKLECLRKRGKINTQ
jgi:hypothetical protein